MAIKDYQSVSKEIIQLSGGKENFSKIENCATRVRITYHHIEKVNIDKLKEIEGVLSVVVQGAVQLVVGPGVCNKLCEELKRQTGAELVVEEETEQKKDNPLKVISDIFVPILPALIAAGIVQGIKNILTTIASSQAMQANIVATESLTAAEVWLQQSHLLGLVNIFGILYNSVFNFLAVYVGYSAAKRLKVNPALGAMVGFITLQPTLSAFHVTAGKGGLFGVIAGVIVLKYVEKYVRKFTPDAIAVICVPTFSMFITATVLILALMPACGVLSDVIINGLLFILDKTGVFGGFVLAALFPTLISTGLHHGLAAIHMEMLNTIGIAPLNAVQVMSNAGMVGAAVGIWLLTRKKNEKIAKAAEGAIPTSFLCVGEPVIYGVCLPSGFGFITGSIGAGVGGACIILFDVAFNAMGMAGMSALPLVADGKYLYYLISYFAGATVACILTYIVGKKKRYGEE